MPVVRVSVFAGKPRTYNLLVVEPLLLPATTALKVLFSRLDLASEKSFVLCYIATVIITFFI